MTDPAQPGLVARMTGEQGASCRTAQIVKNAGDGKVSRARNHATAAASCFHVFNNRPRPSGVRIQRRRHAAGGGASLHDAVVDIARKRPQPVRDCASLVKGGSRDCS